MLPLGFFLVAFCATASAPDSLDAYLREGRIREGLAAYASPTNNAGRFSLAVLQALDGVQQFSAGLGRIGVNPDFARSGLPFLRLAPPDPPPPANETATPEKVARLFKALRASLQQANATLNGVSEEEFNVEVNLSQARLDFDGDGAASPGERFAMSLGRALGLGSGTSGGEDVIVRFDSTDAAWLKGYTHFLGGMLDVLTAYDWRPVWNQCAHLVFVLPEPRPAIARFSAGGKDMTRDMTRWADLIAALHEMRLEPVDRQGLCKAGDQFRAMIACSRLCWKRALSETDNDREWLPSPRQTGPGGAKITQEQVTGWLRVLDELDAILAGKKLLPHWRMKAGTGVNMEKLLASPPRFDPVLLIQGSALIPYLEEGAVSDLATWRNLMAPFGPGFAQFAIWSN